MASCGKQTLWRQQPAKMTARLQQQQQPDAIDQQHYHNNNSNNNNNNMRRLCCAYLNPAARLFVLPTTK